MNPTQSVPIKRLQNQQVINPTISEQVSSQKRRVLSITDYLALNVKFQIGKGSAGKVIKVFDIQENKEQAIKIFYNQDYYLQEKKIVEYITQIPLQLPLVCQDKLNFLLRDQQNLVPTGYRFRNDLCLDGVNQNLALIMDVYTTNLLSYLDSLRRNTDYDLEDYVYIAKVIFAKIFLCVYHLHQNNLYHCDISLDNFLVNIDSDKEVLQVFINDFNHTKGGDQAILTSEKISGKHFPQEIKITGHDTCVIETLSQTIHAKRLDYYALFYCFYQMTQILQIPQENFDQNMNYIMNFFILPHNCLMKDDDTLIKCIFDFEIDDAFIRYLITGDYDYSNTWYTDIDINVLRKELEEITKQQNNKVFTSIVMNQEEKNDQWLFEFVVTFDQYAFVHDMQSYDVNNNNIQYQQKVYSTSQKFSLRYLIQEKYLIFDKFSNDREADQCFEKFKKLIVVSLRDQISEVYYNLQTQQYQQMN